MFNNEALKNILETIKVMINQNHQAYSIQHEKQEKIVEAKYFLQEAAFLNKNAAVAWIAKRDALEQFRVELKKNNYWAVVRGPYGEAELGRMRSNGGFENTYMISASDLLN